MESDCAYFRRRAAEERAVALDCHDPVTRQVHDDLARRYEGLANAAAAFDQYLDRETEAVP